MVANDPNFTIHINTEKFFNGQEAKTLIHAASHFTHSGLDGKVDSGQARGLKNAEDFAGWIMPRNN